MSLRNKLTKILLLINSFYNIILIVFVIGLAICFSYIYKNNEEALNNYDHAVSMLGSKYRKVVHVSGNKVSIVYKVKEKVVEKIVYLPPEGNVVISDPNDINQDVNVVVQDKGFTIRPGFGLMYNFKSISPELDLKLAYYKRYSAGVYGSMFSSGVFFSRHLDDVLPFKATNVELFIGYGFLRYGQGDNKSIGIRTNF